MRSAFPLRSSARPLILMVDDNRDGILARRSVLEELGFEVISACCGEDAIKLVEQHDFDLVVTDYKMAPTDGIQLIRHLRANDFKKPIILLSGFAENLGLTAESTGADAVVQKSNHEVQNLMRLTKKFLSLARKPSGGAAPSSRSQRVASS